MDFPAIFGLLGASILIFVLWLTRTIFSCCSDQDPKMSPDTVSSLFPDRPIRPLPRRRLREKLSPEVADTIKYPPSNNVSIPLFQYPPYPAREDYILKEDEALHQVGTAAAADQANQAESAKNYTPRRNVHGSASVDNSSSATRSTYVARSPPQILNRSANRSNKPDQPRQAHPQAPPSASSSVDGYDSFENTNNKKKRKIPSIGDSIHIAPHASGGDAAANATTTGSLSSDVNGENSYYSTSGHSTAGPYSSSNHGMSGSGRGRLGRSGNARSPLRALSDGNNNWAGRLPRHATPHWATSGLCPSFLFFVPWLASNGSWKRTHWVWKARFKRTLTEKGPSVSIPLQKLISRWLNP